MKLFHKYKAIGRMKWSCVSYKYLPIKPSHLMITRRQILIGHLNLEMVCIFIFNKQGFDVIHAGILRYNGHHDEPSSLCSIL